ncbi:MAG: D,D-dipeptide ABC transporter permease, partial [Microvirga sp.]|nr:D,D-dipeptide ABC transporter permease [Microvirga sp.]
MRSNWLAMLGLAIILTLVLAAIFAPFIATHPPNAQNLAGRLNPPGWQGHLLGTDELGRDIFSRLVYGSRVTLYIVALVALTAPVFGLIVGTLAGTLGGWTDRILMRCTDIFL